LTCELSTGVGVGVGDGATFGLVLPTCAFTLKAKIKTKSVMNNNFFFTIKLLLANRKLNIVVYTKLSGFVKQSRKAISNFRRGSMPQSFKCPACAAPLEYEGGDSPFIKCSFCGNSVIVPEELRSGGKKENAFLQLFESIGSSMPSLEQLTKLKEVKKLVQEGNKIQAIKIYREIFGVGLKEAKDAVEKIEAGQPLVFTQTTFGSTQTDSPSSSIMDIANSMNEVAMLVREGNKIAAIKRYRELTGVGLKEAKEAVEKIEVGHPLDATRFVVQQQQNVTPPTFRVSGFQEQKAAMSIFGCSLASIVIAVVAIAVFGIVIGVFIFLSARPTNKTSVTNNEPPAKTTEDEPVYNFAKVVNSFGSKGIGEGQLNDTRSITADRDGNIYLADYTGGRVQVFDSQGKFVTQWIVGDRKKYISQLAVSRNKVVSKSPVNIDNSDGSYVLYILQTGKILNLDSKSGKPLELMPKINETGFNEDMCVTASGFYVIDSSRHIIRFDSDGNPTLTIKDAIKDLGDTFNSIGKIAVDGRGFIYVLSSSNYMVYKFSPEGKYLNKFGGEGDGLGQFSSVQAIAVDDKARVYVSDSNMIRVFDENGRYVDSFGLKPSSVIFGMAFDTSGQLFVTDRERVYKFAILK
jgi:ribosomal protein L7/L12